MLGEILIVGEAPGEMEDEQGKPFVGPSGQILRQALDAANLSVSDIYITNAVMCRPPQNRQPKKEEMDACRDHVLKVIEEMPNLKLVILLGATALQSVLKQKGITEKRGTVIKDKANRTYIPIFHPAAILRNPMLKETFFRDFVFVRSYLKNEIRQGTYYCCDTKDKIQAAFEAVQGQEFLAFDIETNTPLRDEDPNIARDDIIGFSFTASEYTGYYVPLFAGSAKILDASTEAYTISELKKLLTNPGTKLIMHNGKFDANFIKKKWDIDVLKFYTRPDGSVGTNFYFDTMLAHHILWQEPPHGLKPLARRFQDLAYYEGELEAYKNMNGVSNYGQVPKDIMYRYGASDADAALRLFHIFYKELEEKKLLGLLFCNEQPLTVPIAQAEYHGIKVDRAGAEELGIKLDNQKASLQKEIWEIAGEEFNLNSGPQKARILFEKLGLPKPRKKKKAKSDVPSTAKEVLEKLDHPIAAKLVEHSHLVKMRSTYVTGVLEKLSPDDVLRGNFNIHGTGTGRLSSSGPNMQNIPAKQAFRRVYMARDGYALVSSDFSQIELRVLAKFSQDPKLLQAYWTNEDIHDQVAREVFNVAPGQRVTKDIRRMAKAINFGICYGIQAQSLSKQIGTDEYMAQEYIDKYLTKYAGVYAFQEYIKAFVHEHKFVKNHFGRVHHIVDIDSPDAYIRGEAERTALNSPIQGTAAEITNASAVQIYLIFERLGLDAKLVLTVHDELCYEVRKDQVLQAAKIIHDTMRSMAEQVLQLPVLVEQYVNDRWFDWKTLEQKYGEKMEPTHVPALHQARFLKKNLGIKLRDLSAIPKEFVSKFPIRSKVEVAG